MKLGPVAREQIARYERAIRQGQHTLISGATGSGKTELASQLLGAQARRGAFVVVFVCKLQPDDTLVKSYRDFVRWTDWKRRPRPYENKILLWPKVEGKPYGEALGIQKDVFRKAWNAISATGKWTVYFDEGLYMADPTFLGMGKDMAMGHALGRSGDLTLVTATQRPSHIPLIIYGSASHVFMANTAEDSDLKRLSNLDSKFGRKQLEPIISTLPEHDFLWVQARGQQRPEIVNLSR